MNTFEYLEKWMELSRNCYQKKITKEDAKKILDRLNNEVVGLPEGYRKSEKDLDKVFQVYVNSSSSNDDSDEEEYESSDYQSSDSSCW